MNAPTWFLEELRSHWGPRLLVLFEHYREREIIIPLMGDAFMRVERQGLIEHISLGGPQETAPYERDPFDPSKPVLEVEDDWGGKWYTNPTTMAENRCRPYIQPAEDRSTSRWVIREKTSSGRTPKILDVVDSKGRPQPLDGYVVQRLAARCIDLREAERQQDANAEAEKQEVQQRLDEGLTENFDRVAQDFKEYEQIGWTPKVTQSASGFKVIDNRRFASDGGA